MKNNEKNLVLLAIKAHLVQSGLTMKAAAQELGMSEQGLRNILNGSAPLGPKNIDRLVEVFGYDRTFLKTGEGSLLPDQGEAPAPSSGGVSFNEEQTRELILHLARVADRTTRELFGDREGGFTSDLPAGFRNFGQTK